MWQAVVISNTACSICWDGINVLYQKDSGSAEANPKRKYTPISSTTWPMHKTWPTLGRAHVKSPGWAFPFSHPNNPL